MDLSFAFFSVATEKILNDKCGSQNGMHHISVDSTGPKQILLSSKHSQKGDDKVRYKERMSCYFSIFSGIPPSVVLILKYIIHLHTTPPSSGLTLSFPEMM